MGEHKKQPWGEKDGRAEQVLGLRGRVGAGPLDALGTQRSVDEFVGSAERHDRPDVTLVTLHSLSELLMGGSSRTLDTLWMTRKLLSCAVGIEKKSQSTCTNTHTHVGPSYAQAHWLAAHQRAEQHWACVRQRGGRGWMFEGRQTSTVWFCSASPDVDFKQPESWSRVARYDAPDLPWPSGGPRPATLITHYLQEGPHDIMALARQEASRAFLGNELFWSQHRAAARQRTCAACVWLAGRDGRHWLIHATAFPTNYIFNIAAA